MSFKDVVFKITKEIQQSSLRNEIREAYSDFRKSNDREPFDSIDYVARQQSAQFASFLAVDDNRDKLNHVDNPFKIAELPKNLRTLFEKAHNDVVAFNNSCFSFLNEDLEPSRQALDPYLRLSFKFKPSDNISGLFAEKLLDDVSSEFNKVKPVESILKKSVKGLGNLDSGNIAAAVHHLRQEIIRAGVSNAPNDISDLARSRSNDVKTIMGKFLLDLVSINSIAEICDQLIYQAVFDENLLVINEDSIASFGSESSHGVGAGIEVECQPNSNDFINVLNKVVLLDFEIKGRKFNHFCRVESENISFSQEFGHSVKMKLRYLDDDLNPFFNMYRPG